jgi:CheY-like chemotaxis protein
VEFGYVLIKDSKPAFLKFFVKDTGIGIPKNKHQLIFDRFAQADLSLSKPYEGSGLGLSISKAYVEMLGGEIWVQSEEGKGSQFYFTIPYNHKPISKDKNEISGAKLVSRLKDLTVLIVEDDEIADTYLTIIIESICKKIIHAKTGTDAIEICRENPDIDLILMDIRMPEMDGYEATRRIRKFNKDVIIIAQTAYALAGDRKKVIEAGCNDYTTKPIIKDNLFKIIDQYFGGIK